MNSLITSEERACLLSIAGTRRGIDNFRITPIIFLRYLKTWIDHIGPIDPQVDACKQLAISKTRFGHPTGI